MSPAVLHAICRKPLTVLWPATVISHAHSDSKSRVNRPPGSAPRHPGDHPRRADGIPLAGPGRKARRGSNRSPGAASFARPRRCRISGPSARSARCSACWWPPSPRAPRRSCTRTWDGSTSTGTTCHGSGTTGSSRACRARATAPTTRPTEQVFGHLKDEFFRGRDWGRLRRVQDGPRGLHPPLEPHRTPGRAERPDPGRVPRPEPLRDGPPAIITKSKKRGAVQRPKRVLL